MRSFHSLVSLINKLNSDEYKSLIKYLRYSSVRNESSKSELLLESIKLDSKSSIENIQLKLYGKINSTAFNKLIERLKEKTLEILIFNSNISHNNYPERVRIIFELKKKLIQCDILSLKGLREDSDYLCRKIIFKAQKFELYDIIMSALILRQRFVNVRHKNKEIIKIQNQIRKVEHANNLIIQAQIIYNNLINKISNSIEAKSYYEELKIAINNLELLHKEINSIIILYYLLFLKTEKCQIDENYLEANKFLLKIDSIIKNKSIYSENRVGTTLLNIANNMIYLKQFDESIVNAEESRKYFQNSIFNQSLVDECIFYALYYQNKLFEADLIIKKLLKIKSEKITHFHINKWRYYSAVIDFSKGNYSECYLKLKDVEEIDKDKEGWNINKRLLLIMSSIEMNNLDTVDAQIINLDKYIKRTIKNTDVKLRYNYVVKILLKLINTNFDVAQTVKSRDKYIEKLKDDKSNVRWKYKSPELINFTEWILSKSK